MENTVTQGAVSRIVQALEAELGLALFRRIGRTLVLTSVGAAYLPHISEALESIAAATRSIRRLERGGVLGVPVLPTFAMRWLVPRLYGFQRQHPDILIGIVTHDDPPDVTVSNVDIGVFYGLGQWPHTEATLFMPEDIAVYCSPTLLKHGPALNAPKDLGVHRLLQHTTRADAWHDYFKALGLQPPDMSRSPGFEHLFMLIEAAAAGMGIALLPKYLAVEELESGRSVCPYDVSLRSERAYYITHAKGADRNRTVGLFKAWLLAQVSG